MKWFNSFVCAILDQENLRTFMCNCINREILFVGSDFLYVHVHSTFNREVGLKLVGGGGAHANTNMGLHNKKQVHTAKQGMITQHEPPRYIFGVNYYCCIPSSSVLLHGCFLVSTYSYVLKVIHTSPRTN